MRDSIVFYKSFVDALKALPDEDRLKLYDAIFEFGIYGVEPELSGIDAAVFTLVRPQIEANNRKYENGVKGGRPKNQTETKTKPNHNQTITKPKPNNNQTITKTKPNHNQSITKAEPNDNVNVNDNEKGNGNDNASGSDGPLSLLSYLNEKTGSTYKMTDEIESLIQGRFMEGYTVDQMKQVIDKKCAEWSCDGKMRSYLRPSTLFGDKFEEYVNAPDPIEVEEEKKSKEHNKKLESELEQKQDELDSINEKIIGIVTSGRYLSDQYDVYNELKLKAAILEDGIKSLNERLRT